MTDNEIKGGISIHTLRVEGDPQRIQSYGCYAISIHTLRVEGDFICKKIFHWYTKFQSTPSVWRVTNCSRPLPEWKDISIHTLRVEGD